MIRYDIDTMRMRVGGMEHDNIIVMLYILNQSDDMFNEFMGGRMRTKFDIEADPQGMKFTVATFDDEDNVETEVTLHFVDAKEIFVVMKKVPLKDMDMRDYAKRVIESIVTLYNAMSVGKEFERIEKSKALFIEHCLEQAEFKGFDDMEKETVALLSEKQFSKSILGILKRQSK